MSKVRNLPEIVTLDDEDMFYVVDDSAGPNGGRKLKKQNLSAKAEVHKNSHSPGGTDALITAAPVNVNADGSNLEGVASAFSRSDHKHNISTGTATTVVPNQPNSEGVSSSLSRADHGHLAAVAAPTGNLSPSGSNDAGTASSFSRSDHSHAIATGLLADVTTILPDDASSVGTADRYARADHKHAIAAATASSLTPNLANAEGSSSSFARADHIHNVATAAPVNSGTANAEGSSSSFARADHVHNTVIESSSATATADDTTVSTTDVLMVSMSLTPAAGTYLAMWSGSVANSGAGVERTFTSLYVGGTQVTATERSSGTGGNNLTVHSISSIVTVNGSQAVEVRWRAAAGTSTVRSRRLSLIRIG